MRSLGNNLKRDHFENRVEHIHPIEPKKSLYANLTFWAKTYLDYKRKVDKLSELTLRNYGDSLRYFSEFVKENPGGYKNFREIDHHLINAFVDRYVIHLMLGDKNIVVFDDMTPDDIEELYALHANKFHPTINQRLVHIKACLSFVSKHNSDGVNFKNWYEHIIKYPVPKKADIGHKHLSESEEQNAINALFAWPMRYKELLKRSNRYYAIRNSFAILLMILAGTRARETTRIKLKDISVLEDDISFRMHGKGNKERDVAVDSDTYPEMKELLQELISSAKMNNSEYLLHTGSKKPVSDRDLFKFARWFFVKHGLADYAYLHLFRHTYGTLYVSRGGSLNVLQSNMGHDNQTTTGIYAKSTGLVKREERKRIGQKARAGTGHKSNPTIDVKDPVNS